MKKLNITDRMAYYLGEVHFNEGYIINKNNIKEMIKLCFMNELADEVYKKFAKNFNIKKTLGDFEK